MEMTPVASSNIAAVGYDETTHMLTVQFNNGRTYRYAGVPNGEYQNLLNASSVGNYFATNIKNVFRLG
jgi:hypothetical protein